jgi:hypothetical protein
MDEYIFQTSSSTDLETKPFVDKQILSVNDSNNASYNSRIEFDSTVLANSGKFLDYKEATIQIPFVVSFQVPAVDVSARVNAYIMGLKNGTHHIIDSINVQMQNMNVVQQQSFSNFYVGYKMMSAWSQDDLKKWGRQCIFYPDSSGSMSYVAIGTANPRGDGVSNNVPFDLNNGKLFTVASPLEKSNEGYRKRLEATAFPVLTGGDAGYGALPTALSADDCVSLQKSNFTDCAGGAAGRVYCLNVMATIRLKDIHDFFDKIPLTRGVSLRIQVNYNAIRHTITSTAASGNLVVTTTTVLAGNTCPYMVSDSTLVDAGPPVRNDGPLARTTANSADAVYAIEGNIVQTSSPSSVGNRGKLASSCTLNVPAYLLSPIAEQQYLSLGSKIIEYEDIYMYPIESVTAGGTFNSILTNGIVNPQKLVVIPMLATNPQQSPFDSAPGTTAPLAGITNFNVLLSGRAIFQTDVQYDWDLFQNEVARSDALTGGIETGLTSGLLSKYDWDNAYRYYVVDLSRRDKSEDSVPLSVQVRGKSLNAVALKLYCFISYKRSITLDLATGSILS